MHHHFEFEKVDTLLALDNFVLKLGFDEGTIKVFRAAASMHLIVRHQKHIEVVWDLGTAILKSASFSLDHEDDKDKVARHINDTQCHHSRVLGVVWDQHKERDHLDNEVRAPEQLVRIPLLRQASLVLIDHQVATEAPCESLDGVKDHEIVIVTSIDPAWVLGSGFLTPADKHINDIGRAHHRWDAELKLEEVWVADDATLSNVSDLQVPHRAKDEKEDAG